MSTPTKRPSSSTSAELTAINNTTKRPKTTTTTTPTPTTFLDMFWSQQVETLQAELEHERFLRQLDGTRARQVQAQLEAQLVSTQAQATQTSALLQQHTTTHATMVSDLRLARNRALEQLRTVQLEQFHRGPYDDEEDTTQDRMWEQKYLHLEKQFRMEQQTTADLQAQLDRSRQAQLAAATASPPSDPDPTSNLLEEAPPAILQELNKTRIQLAEVQRANRQLVRQQQTWEQQSHQSIVEREKASHATQRVAVLESRCATLQHDYEELAAEHASWKAFGKDVTELVMKQQRGGSGGGSDGGIVVVVSRPQQHGPPEMVTIVRFLEQAQQESTDMAHKLEQCQAQHHRSQSRIDEMNHKCEQLESSWHETRQQVQSLEIRLKDSQYEIQKRQVHLDIVQRECDSLRALLQTFDEEDMPFVSPTTSGTLGGDPNALAMTTMSPKFNPAVQTLQVRLQAIEEELKVVQAQRDGLEHELESTRAALHEETQQHQHVRSRFGKLREALLMERTKVANAEQRALNAESLAGKGSFNPESTRVLHLKETPMVEALKEEIKVLQRQLEVTKGDKSLKRAPDPEKLNQRLKENFKEQIAKFREGVYLMTGFKVDMLPGTERVTFRVRSVFAEHEEDQLMLQWPKTEHVTSLDILKTPMAEVLATTPSYDYMTKFGSLPAFLASVQLSLFEKQTIML